MATIAERVFNDHPVVTEDRTWFKGVLDRVERETRMELEAQLAEAERVLKLISGWNTDRVSTAEAIQPALAYFAAKAVPRV